MKTSFLPLDFVQRILLMALFGFALNLPCFAAPETDELTDDSIVALVAAEQEFNMDDYQAQLEAVAGDDYKRMQAMHERFNAGERRREEAKQEKQQRFLIILVLSLIVSLTPAFVILKQVITGEIQPAGAGAVCKTIGVLFGWGIVLFALNFGWLWVMFNDNTQIMRAILGLALLIFVIYASLSVSRYNKKHKE